MTESGMAGLEQTDWEPAVLKLNSSEASQATKDAISAVSMKRFIGIFDSI